MTVFEQTRDYTEAIALGEKYRFKDGEKEPTPITNQFVPMAFNSAKDREWRLQNRCPLGGYLYIAHKAVRKPGKHDLYDLYHRYFMNNKIAAAPGLRNIADAFGYKQLTQPSKWVKELERQGAFIIEHIPVKGKPEPANVYVLGEYLPNEIVWYYGNLRIPRKDI